MFYVDEMQTKVQHQNNENVALAQLKLNAKRCVSRLTYRESKTMFHFSVFDANDID